MSLGVARRVFALPTPKAAYSGTKAVKSAKQLAQQDWSQALLIRRMDGQRTWKKALAG
ncbi:hypothetical protein [cf. Phormidesmis sp. LEGE 11477]|uniref:hypothetical protein n=1 Tax=cf. Phormidesmis sp. LEGE 11477 TaxID=1828680 RepID=UPI00187DE1AE|nr:hypothetical protein [cf. Phormidesmis sp. LEGE 11477]MBE9060240.1 hypothetical protein [cf. Phormidesmis sp. LEGE 11477]